MLKNNSIKIMKVEFALTIDQKTGEPIIKFRHHDKSDDLQQKLLGVFIAKAQERGIKLVNPTGYLETGTLNSFENYEIKIKA